MTIEVEKRGLLSKKQFEQLPTIILSLGGIDLGKNDTESIFYLLVNMQVKIQHSTSRNTAKIAWKSGGVDGSPKREEIEVNISVQDYANAEQLMQKLLPDTQRFLTAQKRHDFILHDVQIAVKHSNDWGYHVELERLVDSETKAKDTLKNIDAIAKKLNVVLFTADEERQFVEDKIAARKKITN